MVQREASQSYKAVVQIQLVVQIQKFQIQKIISNSRSPESSDHVTGSTRAAALSDSGEQQLTGAAAARGSPMSSKKLVVGGLSKKFKNRHPTSGTGKVKFQVQAPLEHSPQIISQSIQKIAS